MFGLFKNKDDQSYPITEADRNWIEANFNWLVKVYGYPNRKSQQILFTENYFPKTFQKEGVLIEHIKQDLCSLLRIREEKISFEIVNDSSSSYGMPYQTEAKLFET